MNVKQILVSVFVMTSSIAAYAGDFSNSNECVNYMNSARPEVSESARLEKALLALNLAFDLKLSEKDYIKIETLVANKSVSQDRLEKIAFMGCTYEVTASDQKLAQEEFKTLLQ
ncbi:hypothetical protein AZI86_01775 [Bdellovibrio bacteriovorus]|uniref:DUF4476 domain-containing protein n=1 Tax=Bdellovibrio bacteriovorus TaxID=959 RepID=A0A150WN58_BDEBC|nr:hypothetical protein [Bdellovibrio bacteriovorus]KYG65828.1 hypothetical protein AZI86_01775 [Bdellovibrio bacteriovorus]